MEQHSDEGDACCTRYLHCWRSESGRLTGREMGMLENVHGVVQMVATTVKARHVIGKRIAAEIRKTLSGSCGREKEWLAARQGSNQRARQAPKKTQMHFTFYIERS
jgi:hypothetical protein